MSGHLSSSHAIVLSSKTCRPCIPFGARKTGHSRMMWSAVCSSAPHSQAAEDTKPHLCISEWKCPPPVWRWFNLTHARWGRVIPLFLEPMLPSRMKVRSLVALDCHCVPQLWSDQDIAWSPRLSTSLMSICVVGTNGFRDFNHRCSSINENLW